MAATVTLLGSTFNTTSGTHTVTATPAVGDLIVIICAHTGSLATTLPTDNNTGGAGTYVLDRSAQKASGVDIMYSVVRSSLITVSASTVFTLAPGTTTGGGLAVYSISGMTAAGLSAIRHDASTSNVAAGGTPNPSFGAAALSANPIISAVFNASSPGGVTARTSPAYTRDLDVGYSTPTTGLDIMHINSGETATSLQWGSTSATAFSTLAMELAYDSPPTVALNTPADTSTVSTTTPQLDFTGTDADGDAISYEVEVDTANTFDSQSSSATDTYTAPTTWTAPAGVTSVTVECWAAGGGGGSIASSTGGTGGGGGGAYSSSVLTVVPGTTYTVTVGTGGAAGVAGGDSWFNTSGTVLAKGGGGVANNTTTGASGGLASSGIGTTKFDGGSGAASPATKGGGGGGGAGSTGNGGSTTTSTGGTGTANGGGAGGTGNIGLNGGGVNGTAYGGGGGGSTRSSSGSSTGGSGANGAIAISYTSFLPLIDKLSASDTGFTDITNGAHTDPFTSGEQIGYTTTALTNGTTYYWRVRGKDPSGSNTFGAWATTRSFTVSIPQAFSTLTDDFSTGTLSATKWAAAYGNAPTFSAGQVSLSTTLNSTVYSGWFSLNYYDLTGTSAYVQCITAGNQTLTGLETFPLQLEKDASNKLAWYITNGTIAARKTVAGSGSNVATATYSTTTHQWLRIRESSGTIFWDYSSDGSTWNNLTSLANPFAVTAMKQEFALGNFTGQAATSATFDNFNIVPTTTTSITKSIKYTVKVAPTAPTKSLKYTIKATPSALTKALRYAVKKPFALTKGIKYTITKAVALTKSLKYTTSRTPTAITLNLKYTTKLTPTALTKSLRYATDKAVSVTRSLKYTIKKTPTALTKSVIYEIKNIRSITKAFIYDVKKAQSLTKSLKYTITKPVAAVTKTLKYSTKITPSSIAKSLKYTIKITPVAITKSVRYGIDKVTAITKSLKYTTQTTPSVKTKALQYIVATKTALTKSLIYDVKAAKSITKGLKYTIVKPATAITKSLRYAIDKPLSLTKQIKYVVKAPASLTKVIKYTVKAPVAVTKQLKYTVPTTAVALTKSVRYAIRRNLALTKNVIYDIKRSISLTETLKYTVKTSTTVTKALKYTTRITAASITKQVIYTVKKPVALTKGLKYTTTAAHSLTKALIYDVKRSLSITKTLIYRLPGLQYFRESKATLPTTNAILATRYNSSDMTKAATVDSVYVDLPATSTYQIHEFASYNASQSTITLTWTGKSAVAGSTAAINLQIYNFNSASWETLASNTTVAANTALTLTGNKVSSLANYYDANNYVWGRVWQ